MSSAHGASVKTIYELCYEYAHDRQKRARLGKIVVHEAERQYEVSRQGRIRFYILPQAYDDTALEDWWVFKHEIRSNSGKHRHQGGLVIFVLDGQGYTTVDGARVDWKAGDLILLPLRPGGVVHQHFNTKSDGPWHWLAFIHLPTWNALASELEQREDSPEYHPDGTP